MEANGEKRDKYLEEISQVLKENMVYIDESGIDMSISRDRGWGLKSKKLIGKKSGKYYIRTNNIIAGLNINKPIAPMVF